MKKIILVYNPVSGLGKVVSYMDYIINYFQQKRVYITIVRIPFNKGDILKLLNEDFQGIIVAGGDGTLNTIINLLAEQSCFHLPIAILPAGTSNDFASNLGVSDFIRSIEEIDFNKKSYVDLGKVNDKYFVNVASGGMIIDVAHKVDQKLKNNLGKMAYYLKGVTELTGLRTIELEIKTGDKLLFSGDAYLYLILNGRSAGSFKQLAPMASLRDGLLDCLVFKKCPPRELLNIFLKVLSGKHINNENILYFQQTNYKIYSPKKVSTDVDGEEGPALPWEIENLHKKLTFLVP